MASRSQRFRIIPRLEALEDRAVPAAANLTAYRPMTEHINYANFRVAESQDCRWPGG